MLQTYRALKRPARIDGGVLTRSVREFRMTVERVRCLVMAGGRSERMRDASGGTHKALVEVAGISLLERNLRSLAQAGLRDIVVIYAPDEPAIGHRVKQLAPLYAEQYGADVKSWIEARPLGNIGAVRAIGDDNTVNLVIYVDNLTALNLRAMIGFHQLERSALTIATHRWTLRNPFGELEIENGSVISYHEKPTRVVRISSGTCLVSPQAAAQITTGRSFGAVELFEAVKQAGLPVRAFEHDAPWIDVNDGAALHSAEDLLRRDPNHFTT